MMPQFGCVETSTTLLSQIVLYRKYDVELVNLILSFYDVFFSSCNMKLNLDYLLETVWEYLALVRVYTKKRGGLCRSTAYKNYVLFKSVVRIKHC